VELLGWSFSAGDIPTMGTPSFAFEAVKKPSRKLIDRKTKQGKLWA
jgi:hypothetical protein